MCFKIILVLQGATGGFLHSPNMLAMRGRPGETRGPKLPKIFANCATCGWETLTMLNPQLVAGKHGFFGDHESEDIRTIFCKLVLKRVEIF